MTRLEPKISPSSDTTGLCIEVAVTSLSRVQQLQRHALDAGRPVSVHRHPTDGYKVRIELPRTGNLQAHIEYMVGVVALCNPEGVDARWAEIRAAGDAALGRRHVGDDD